MEENWDKVAAAGMAAATLFIGVLLVACGQAASPPAIPTNKAGLLPSPTPIFKANPTDAAARETRIAPFGNTCPESEIIRNMSPEDEWTFCDGHNSITVINELGQKRSFSYENDFGSGSFVSYTNPIYWSLDEHFLYFAPMATIAWNQALPYNGLALYRMDLSSDKVQTMLPPVGTATSRRSYTLSISPTGRRLAYVLDITGYDPAEIVILDLKTGEKRSIHPGATADNIGGFTWSPDGIEMTYWVYDPTINESFYFTYDMATFELIRSEPFNP